MAYLEPGYNCPGRTFFTGEIEKKHKEATVKLSSIFSAASFLCLTTDTWTSVATESYLTITVHYVSHDWLLKSRVLGTLFLDERHTGKHISEWILQMLSKFGIDPSNVTAVVHDNASNMVSAMQILKESHGWESIRCSAHTLQLAVNSALADTHINTVLGRARKLVEYFRRSTVPKSALEKQQEQMLIAKPLDLVQDIATRWSSTYSMCQRLKELRLPLSMVMANRQIFDSEKRQQLELTTEEWNVLEILCDLLKPFAVLTKHFEGQSYVSISAVQPLIKGTIIAMRMDPADPKFAMNFKREATKQLETRFSNLFSVQAPTASSAGFVSVAVKATALDTRFHKLKSLNIGQPRVVRTILENELFVFGQRQNQTDNNPASDSPNEGE